MVDLHGQYMKIKAEIDAAIAEVIDSSAYINGPAVGRFASALAQYTGARHVIPCGNGTDALQIALMALGPAIHLIRIYVLSRRPLPPGPGPSSPCICSDRAAIWLRYWISRRPMAFTLSRTMPSPSEPSTPSPTAAAGIPAPSGTSAAPHSSLRRTSAAMVTAVLSSRMTMLWRSASAWSPITVRG